jgi:ABC-type Na+ efflux pump permease subunit
MDRRRYLAIAKKDMKETFSSIAIYGPMIGIPLFFAIVLPIFTSYVSRYAGPALAAKLVGIAPIAGAQGITGFIFISFFATNVLGPIFLTMPIITASVIAADSFAGEKERKTAEALLATPASNAELLLGKVLASLIPAAILTVVIFAIYGSITNYMAYSDFGKYIFPNTAWYMMLLNSPFLALTTIGLVVLVSARAKGIKEAQQISTLLVLPVLIIPFISIFDVASLSFTFFAGMLAVLIAASAAVMYLSAVTFDREKFVTA